MEFFMIGAGFVVIIISSYLWYRIGYDAGADATVDYFNSTSDFVESFLNTSDEFQNFVLNKLKENDNLDSDALFITIQDSDKIETIEISKGEFIYNTYDDINAIPDVAIRDTQNYKD